MVFESGCAAFASALRIIALAKSAAINSLWLRRYCGEVSGLGACRIGPESLSSYRAMSTLPPGAECTVVMTFPERVVVESCAACCVVLPLPATAELALWSQA